MKRGFCCIAICLALGLALGGCQRATYKLRGQPTIPLAAPESIEWHGGPSVPSRTVRASGYAHYMFWGVLPVSQPNLNEEVQPLLRTGEAVGDVQITESNSFLCGLLAGITYGIYRPRYVEMTATVYGGGR
jgi:hypothetical protein